MPAGDDRLMLRNGENAVRVFYEGSQGPAPWSRLEFKTYGPPERVSVKRAP